ncbi:DNA-binding MarR family transcriptional regulator [Elusimicrobium simillimum]|uniref:MarR family winged helix-turn-helix transcriptional regulator n=1 Tax=Elusimicrobium simillimum TaxID=3143438 RepID=UPI003C6EEFB2
MPDFRDYGILPEKGRNYEAIVYVMALIYNMINNEASSYLAKFDLTPAKYNILMIVKYTGGKEGMSQVDICKRLIVSAGNITKILDRLTLQGFITRSPSKTDRRVNVIKITAAGSDVVEKAWEQYDAIIKRSVSHLNQTEQKQLTSIFKKWFAALMNK